MSTRYTRGVWSLENVELKKPEDDWVDLPSVWISNDNFGHGHFFDSQLRRYNISNSTVVKAGPTYFVRYHDTGGGSQEHTYWSGGGANTSTISKLVYSTYTTTASLPTKVLSTARNQMASVSKNTDVYYTGGNHPSVPAVSTTQKLTFSNDSIALLPGSHYPKSNGEDSMCSFNDGGTYGYFWGGTVGTTETKVIRLTFSNDTMAALPGTTYPSGQAPAYAGMWNLGNTTKGYNVGGVWVSYTKKLTYASETFVYAPGANYPNSIGQATAFTAGADTGLVNSGRAPANRSDTNLLTFSTDSWAAAPAMDNPDISSMGNDYGSGTGTSARDSKIGGAPSYTKDGSNRWVDDIPDLNVSTPNNGYFIGGFMSPSGDNWSSNKINMTNDTLSHTPTVWDYSVKRAYSTGTREKTYFGGGGRSRVFKFTYSTDTAQNSDSGTAMITGTSSDWAQAATGTQEVGYIGGGADGPGSTQSGTSILRKMTFSSETLDNSFANITAAPNARFRWSAFGNQTMGYWFAGKNSSSFISYVSKMVYSTETITADTMTKFGTVSPSSKNGGGVSDVGHTSNDTHGYTIGGLNGPIIDEAYKLAFDSDTYTYLPSVNAPSGIYLQSATGNNDSGYWAGGWRSIGGMTSYVTKLDFSTDTQSVNYDVLTSSPGGVMFGGNSGASPRMRGLVPRQPSPLRPPLATPTPSTTLTGPEGIKAEGYLIQGTINNTSNPGRSDSHRLDYSTETWSSSANSPRTRKDAGATSTTTNAYIAGGTVLRVDGGSHGHDMDKYTYATSTFSSIPGSDAGDIPGPGAVNKRCAAGNQTQGYWAFNADNQSKCSKLTYSTETGSNLPNLPWNAKNSVGVSKQTEGYYGSGDGFDDKGSSFVKITFSNDTYASYSGWTPHPAKYRCGSSSSTKAYIVGGQNDPRQLSITPWATNSTTNSPTTFLQSPGYSHAPGQGSNEAGYFTGGGNVGNNGTNTEKITYATDTTAMVPSAEFPGSPITSYSTGGPNMNGLGTNVPNVI